MVNSVKAFLPPVSRSMPLLKKLPEKTSVPALLPSMPGNAFDSPPGKKGF
jgi:hypothetical protein